MPIDLEVVSTTEESKTDSEQEDTWKTIKSMGNCSGPQDMGDTKNLTTKERLALKKIEEAKKREAELNAHSASEYKVNQTISNATKKKNMFGHNTESIKSEMMVHTKNKAVSEIKQKKEKVNAMEQAQDIPLDFIFNTIHNIAVHDADDEFEEVPGNSSYIPVPASKVEKTVKKPVYVAQPKEEEIEEDIDEELEEYYD